MMSDIVVFSSTSYEPRAWGFRARTGESKGDDESEAENGSNYELKNYASSCQKTFCESIGKR
jgi:hypothetical protein